MAYVTKSNQENKEVAAEDPQADEPDEKPEEKEELASSGGTPLRSAPKGLPASAGFFTIYKKGQGYWTRMGTAIGIALIAVFTAYNLYVYIPTFITTPPPPVSMTPDQSSAYYHNAETLHQRIAVAVAGAFLLGFAALGFWLSNKPENVDFLIATDSEMKKVNWTSRRELIGSTKIVIIFMFSVAIFLFVVDILFGYLFYLMHVLKNGPFGA